MKYIAPQLEFPFRFLPAEPPPYTDFGLANLWEKDPPLCRHGKRRVVERRCLNRYYCDICRVTYLVDSSD